MATLILSAVGTVFGGPLGGAIGALIGRQVDSAVIGNRKINGPRLKELSVQTSSYGSALPLHFGRIRASGSVIWATELMEHSEKSGGGKGRPSVTSYSYTASFAVAVGSRPIIGIGRIWADGNLLRGEAGDLKVGGKLRVHTGHGDQAPDILLSQAEGAAVNPAYRNLAYVVFEDLELAEFGNRLPSLTFEIIADEQSVTIADIAAALVPDAQTSDLDSTALSGFTVDQGSAGDVLATIAEMTPLVCIGADELIRFTPAEPAPSSLPPMLPAPTTGGDGAEDARADGWSRRRDALPTARQCAVRYYDVARDYQPGMQRSIGRSGPGDVVTIEMPVAMTALEARALADRAARRSTLARDTLRYRIAEIDARFAPGAIVRTPVTAGTWRIEQWEWQADGVMLDLASVPVSSPAFNAADSGRSNQVADVVAVPTALYAFELPWSGDGDGATPALRVAATAASSAWKGAALYAEQADGAMYSLAATGRTRSIAGKALTALAQASPLLLDLANTVDIELAAEDFALNSATWAQLMQGANKALLGEEIVQFARSEHLGGRSWRLSALLRGRGGTEHAVTGHLLHESFVLLDETPLTIAPSVAGDAANIQIVAIGLGDATPVSSAITNAGITLRPLSAVHGKAAFNPDGSLSLRWTRRSRGAWKWPDEVDTPLNENEERWQIEFGSNDSVFRYWQTTTARLDLSAAAAAELMNQPGENSFRVRQIGRESRSLPLTIAMPV